MFAGSPADQADDFVARYLPDRDKPRPGLENALEILAALPETNALLAGLGSSCRALIQGYASHGNADALRRSLLASGVVHPRISAVDLLDLPEIFARLGLKMPEMEFVRADARDLRDWYGDGIFSLVAQDFLLNAAPPFQAADLLAEARRLLDPAGILVLSFTDSTCLEVLQAITPRQLETEWGLHWDPTCAAVVKLGPSGDHGHTIPAALLDRAIADPSSGTYAFVTAPHGRLEFFVPLQTTLNQLGAAGFEMIASVQEKAYDDHGLHCLRHRCLMRPVRASV